MPSNPRPVTKSPTQRTRRRAAPAPAPLRTRVRAWLEADGESVFCAGLARILEAVRDTGSIKSAALIVGRSYRSVRARLKQVHLALGTELIDAHVGGPDSRRSSLTPLGEALLDAYLAFRRELCTVSDANQKRFDDLLARHRSR